MPRITNLAEVEAYLRSIPADASEKRRWQAVTVATRALLRSQKVANANVWTVEALPPQAHRRHGDCSKTYRRIRYRKQFVQAWWVTSLAHVIVHESAHAITGHEMTLQGKYGDGGHGPMWRGVMATLSYSGGRAHNLPTPRKELA